MPSRCVCCGRTIPGAPVQQIHLDCWIEHHSDPSGPWPPEHACSFGKCGEPLGYYDARCALPDSHDGGCVGPFAIERSGDA